jgi:hypothetical protein
LTGVNSGGKFPTVLIDENTCKGYIQVFLRLFRIFRQAGLSMEKFHVEDKNQSQNSTVKYATTMKGSLSIKFLDFIDKNISNL